MATDRGAPAPDAHPQPDDPRAAAALEELRRLVGGRRRPADVDHPPPLGAEAEPFASVPPWVGLADRARARWLRQPPGRRAAVGLAAVAATVGGGWWLVRTPPLPAEATLPLVAPVPTSWSTATAPPSTVVVHAAGAVRDPGVQVLPAGSRVAELLDAAGGADEGADLDRLNLAAPLRDGERVYVPEHGEAVPPAVAPSGPDDAGTAGAPLDLNLADQAALEALPGVGPATAAAIVAHRDEHGPFTAVDDLLGVRGIGPAKLDALAPLVVVSG